MASTEEKVIGMVLDAPFPPDIRVEKECKALLKNGFRVDLLCENRGGEPFFEVVNGINVYRVVCYKNNFARKLALLMARVTFVALEWYFPIRKFVSNSNVKVLHVHDLQIANTVIKAVKGLDTKIIVDLHENFPSGCSSAFKYSKGLKRWFLQRVFSYERWLKHEANIINKVNHVIAVVDEMKERLEVQHETLDSKITVITNTEEKEFANHFQKTQVNLPSEDVFTLLYIGSFSGHRGLETAIEAMSLLVDYPIELVIIGSGSEALLRELNRKILEFRVRHKVHLLPRIPFSEVPAVISKCNVGLVPHARIEQTDNTIPHKLFQYMLLGTPVLVSSARPLQRVVEQTKSGLVFEAGNAKSFSEMVLKLYKNKPLFEELGRNGRNATFLGDLNWEFEGRKLVKFYEEFFKKVI